MTFEIHIQARKADGLEIRYAEWNARAEPTLLLPGRELIPPDAGRGAWEDEGDAHVDAALPWLDGGFAHVGGGA